MSGVYALQGPGNCGKSTTIISLYNDVRSKYPAATVRQVHDGTADIAVIISGVDGMIIGIESQGDPGSRLKNTLDAFVAEKCDVIFCACRTRGMTVGWINALSPQYNIHFVRQNWVSNDYDAVNRATAVMLMQRAGI